MVNVNDLLLSHRIKKILINSGYETTAPLIYDLYNHFNNILAISKLGKIGIIEIILAINASNDKKHHVEIDGLPKAFQLYYKSTVTDMFYIDYLLKMTKEIKRNSKVATVTSFNDIDLSSPNNSHSIALYEYSLLDKNMNLMTIQRFLLEINFIDESLNKSSSRHHTFLVATENKFKPYVLEPRYHILNSYLRKSAKIITIKKEDNLNNLCKEFFKLYIKEYITPGKEDKLKVKSVSVYPIDESINDSYTVLMYVSKIKELSTTYYTI